MYTRCCALFGLLAAFLHFFQLTSGYSCIYIICDDNSYCCGEETCCFNYGAIWYAWVLIVFVIIFCCIFGCYYRKRRTALIVSNPAPAQHPNATVIVHTQQQQQITSQQQPRFYGAAGGHPPQGQPHYSQHPGVPPKYMDAPPVYQPQGYQGVYQTGPPAYQGAPVMEPQPKVPNAPPQWS